MGIKKETGLMLDSVSSGVYTIKGIGATTNDIFLHANQADSYPRIRMLGTEHIVWDLPTGKSLIITNQTTESTRITCAGQIHLMETSTPTAIPNYGAIYCKNDNKIYFQDGAGTEHEIAFV
jgi:hypothetical protein